MKKKKSNPALFYFIGALVWGIVMRISELPELLSSYLITIIPIPLDFAQWISFFLLIVWPGLIFTKMALVSALPHYLIFNVIPSEEFLDLGFDIDALSEKTAQLKELGFEELVTFNIDDQELTMAIDGVARLFVNHESHCLCEIWQILPKKELPKQGAIPFSCSFHSKFLNDYSFSATTHKISGFTGALHYVWRSPKGFWSSDPKASLTDLYQLHLAKRTQLIAKLNLSIFTELTWEFYVQEQKKAAMIRYQNLKRKNTLISFWEIIYGIIYPQLEWFGTVKI